MRWHDNVLPPGWCCTWQLNRSSCLQQNTTCSREHTEQPRVWRHSSICVLNSGLKRHWVERRPLGRHPYAPSHQQQSRKADQKQLSHRSVHHSTVLCAFACYLLPTGPVREVLCEGHTSRCISLHTSMLTTPAHPQPLLGDAGLVEANPHVTISRSQAEELVG